MEEVAIVGAGIAGLALAMGLHRKGVRFTLYEEAKEFSAVGAGIGFAPNGLQAMDLIEPGFRPRYEKVAVGNKPADAQDIFFEGMLLKEGLGRVEPWFDRSSWGHPDFNRKSAHRKALLDIMTSFIPTECVKFNRRLIKIEQTTENVLLHFAGGEVATASVLVGADGIQSTVREHVLSEKHHEQATPVYAAAYCYRGVIPMSESDPILGGLTDVAKMYFGHNQGAVTYRISGGAELNFLLCQATNEPWPYPDAVTQKVSVEEMMADFQGPQVDERFRQLLRKAKPVRWGFFHHKHTSTYCRDRVVLMGDCAHASLPFQAAGAAQGVEDALVLSNVLAELAKLGRDDTDRGPKIAAGLAAYDAVRRPRAQHQLEQSEEVAQMIYFQHKETGDDMVKILAKLQNGRFDWLWFHDNEEDVQKALSMMRQGTAA